MNVNEHPTPKQDDQIPPLPKVSVIIPARNAADTLPATLNAVLAQDYGGPLEVVVADGSDTPDTGHILRQHYPTVRVVPNPEQITPTGLNYALQAATGEFIVRCDTHAMLPPHYVRRAIATLERTGAAIVGGQQHSVGTTLFTRALAIAQTTPLGVGNARYRLGGAEGPTDTVYLGTWRRETLQTAGGFDRSLIRNQDYELNWRLRQRGKTVWFDPDLTVTYHPRSNLWALTRQYFDYGRWKAAMLRQHPPSLQARQLAAPLLVLGLVASALLALAAGPLLAMVVPLAYLCTLVVGSVTIGVHRRDPAALLLPLVLAAMHLSWGIGFFLPAPQKMATVQNALANDLK